MPEFYQSIQFLQCQPFANKAFATIACVYVGDFLRMRKSVSISVCNWEEFMACFYNHSEISLKIMASCKQRVITLSGYMTEPSQNYQKSKLFNPKKH